MITWVSLSPLLYFECLPILEESLTRSAVYIVEEHDSVRSALVERLSQAPAIEVVGHSGMAEMVIEEIPQLHPDVVLLEVKRSDGMGLELLRRLKELPEPPKIVVLTSYPAEWEEESAARTGADAYVLKDIDTDELLRIIEASI
jgi:DNA-binding NarL/FixJ family response regulator